jgi:hypothetical protein
LEISIRYLDYQLQAVRRRTSLRSSMSQSTLLATAMASQIQGLW